MTAAAELLSFSEAVRVQTLEKLAPATQARLGQFSTNAHTSSTMTAMLRLPYAGDAVAD